MPTPFQHPMEFRGLHPKPKTLEAVGKRFEQGDKAAKRPSSGGIQEASIEETQTFQTDVAEGSKKAMAQAPRRLEAVRLKPQAQTGLNRQNLRPSQKGRGEFQWANQTQGMPVTSQVGEALAFALS